MNCVVIVTVSMFLFLTQSQNNVFVGFVVELVWFFTSFLNTELCLEVIGISQEQFPRQKAVLPDEILSVILIWEVGWLVGKLTPQNGRLRESPYTGCPK